MLNDTNKAKGILDMVQGGVNEIISNNVADILINIKDPNTDLKARELTVKVVFKPSDTKRRKVDVTYQVTNKQRPINPLATSIVTGTDEDGQLQAVELLEDISGQMRIDGTETPQPTVITFPQKNAGGLK